MTNLRQRFRASQGITTVPRKTFMPCLARMRKVESTHRRKYDYDNNTS